MIRVIVDSKLMAYNASYQRRQSILATLDSIENAIQYMVTHSIITGDYEVIFGYDFGKSSYRKGLLPTYKGHRTEGHKDKTPEELKEYDDFQNDYRWVLPELSKALGIRTVGVEGLEYDDIASIMAHTNNTDKIIILSEDHDMLQVTIARRNVAQFMPKTYRFYTMPQAKALEGVSDKLEFLVAKTIKGDYGDAIKGLNMCGEVCFNEWFKPLAGQGLTYDDWKEAVVSLAESNSKYSIHKHYTDIGIDNFADFFDFNMKLGETMTDTSLLSKQQAKDYKEALFKIHHYDKELFRELTKNYINDAENEFGDIIIAPTYPAIRGLADGG